MPQPEPWLRGPVPDVPDLLQPVAHALLAADEEIRATVEGLPAAMLWARPGGAASIGFHLLHLTGSTDRLFAYARAEPLSDGQRAALSRERDPETRAPLEDLLRDWNSVVDRALSQLRSTPPDSLTDARRVGRAGLPSTVLGLLMHAAEHAARHAGQITTTRMLLRPPAAHLSRVSLVVRDYDEAIAFFTGRLGFRLVEDTYQPEQDKRWVVVAPPRPDSASLVLARASTEEQRAAIGNQTGGRVGFFLNTDDFERDFRAFTAAGIEFVRPPASQPYGKVAVFRDLYGNLWDLIGPGQPGASP